MHFLPPRVGEFNQTVLFNVLLSSSQCLPRELSGYRSRSGSLIAAINAHIHPVLEYGSVISSNVAESHTTQLERAQHKFLIWFAVISNCPILTIRIYVLRHFLVLQIALRLPPRDLNLPYDVFSSRVDLADILGRFALAVSARTIRVRPISHEPLARAETVKNGMFCRATRLTDVLYESNPDEDLKVTILILLASCLCLFANISISVV